MDSDEYLYVAILTIKRRRSERLEGNHNVQIMQLCRSKRSAPTRTTYTSFLDREKGSYLIIENSSSSHLITKNPKTCNRSITLLNSL